MILMLSGALHGAELFSLQSVFTTSENGLIKKERYAFKKTWSDKEF